MDIGKRINELRKAKGITLQELSQKSGVALATLSRMENGKMTGTVKSHQMICKALGASIADLYREIEDNSKTVESVTSSSRAEHLVHSSKARYELLVARHAEKKITPLLLRLDPSGETQKEETKPGTDKFVYVMNGTIEAYVGEKAFLLKKGDSLYFDASLPHQFKNRTKTAVEAICVVTSASV